MIDKLYKRIVRFFVETHIARIDFSSEEEAEEFYNWLYPDKSQKRELSMKKIIRICAWTMSVFAVVCLALMLICNQMVVNNAEGKVFADIDSIRYNNVTPCLALCDVILDCYGSYIAVSDRDIIYILRWSQNSNSKLEEIKYRCMSYDGKVELLINNDYATFDPIDKKFSVDVDLVQNIYDKKDSSDYDDYSEYSIMDALDGEPDAYWNID